MGKQPKEAAGGTGALRARWAQAPRAAALPVLGMAMLTAWSGVAGAALAPPDRAAAGSRHGFNFAYQSEGGRSAAPTQVFDDGQRTYMQFNALDRVPELWAEDPGAHGAAKRLAFHLESPYVVIDQVLPRLRLVIDGQESVLVNQAWKTRNAAVRAAGGRVTLPRIWTDNTPFGPDDPPGPVAADRSARPSHDGPRGRPATQALADARHGERRLAIGNEEALDGGREPADGDPAQADVPTPEAATAQLADRPFAAADPLVEARLQAMQAQALDMIARAREAGDLELENRLRGIFRDIAQASALPPADAAVAPTRRGRDPRRHQGPLLALAETRPRSDVPLHDDAEEGSAVRSGNGSGVAAVEAAQPTHADAAETGAPVAGRPADGIPAGPAAAAPTTGAAAAHASPGAATPRTEPLVFEVRDNQRLSQALGHFLETLGWRLEWESQSDFVVRRGYVVQAPTLKQVLLQTLGEYRLSAVLYSGNLVVAVSGGDR